MTRTTVRYGDGRGQVARAVDARRARAGRCPRRRARPRRVLAQPLRQDADAPARPSGRRTGLGRLEHRVPAGRVRSVAGAVAGDAHRRRRRGRRARRPTRLDLDRVVSCGHSAGGHLALWLGARPGLAGTVLGGPPVVPVRARSSLAGVCDLRAALRAGRRPGRGRELLGGSPDEVPDRYDLASPSGAAPARHPAGADPRPRRHRGAARRSARTYVAAVDRRGRRRDLRPRPRGHAPGRPGAGGMAWAARSTICSGLLAR